MKVGKIVLSVICVILVAALISLCVLGGLQAYKWDGISYIKQSDGAEYDAFYYTDKVEHKKVMLLIPGLMASTLYDLQTNDPMWGYNGFIKIAAKAARIIESGTEEEKEAYLNEVLATLSCDENNVPKTKARVGTMEDGDKYASFQGMMYLYKILEPLYGDKYDVVVWQYDWRQNNMGSALELQRFIKANGWTETMFFTHSMGGIVTANYLSLSEQNRKQTSLFMPFGAPFLGSMDAITNIFNSEEQSGFMNDIISNVGSAFGQPVSLVEIARTLASVYELLPFAEYDNTQFFNATHPSYVGRKAAINFAGNDVTANGLRDKISEFSWAKRKDGTNMPAINMLLQYRENLFIDNGKGEKVFVTELVPTEYIVGIGVSTTVAASIDANGFITEKVKSDLGDGTVPAYSATAGRDLNDSHVHLVEGIQHGPLANDLGSDTKEKTGLKYVEGILKQYVK